MMNTGRLSLIAATLTLAALTAVPSASAAPAGESAPRPAAPASAAVPAAAAADGHLHTWFHINYDSYCAGWVGNSGNWGRCRNQVSSLFNNGYPGNLDDVWVHWGTNCTGARRGVHNGVRLANLTQWTFDRNTGPGSGQALNDNISSHCWTNLP